jgi:hypothetical protein
MADIIFYPLRNADCCLIRLDNGHLFVFDYADKFCPSLDDDRRMPLQENFRSDVGWPDRKEIDVLAVTHGDDDHVKGIGETFWLEHAQKYQSEDRIKAKELWVPAAMIVEEACEDDTRIVQAEARHRLLKKQGIRVFSRPERLKDWFEERGLRLEDFCDVITDAGRPVPNWDLENNGIEFFVHAPFAQRTADGLLDRNENCLVMQATIRAGAKDVRFLITADSVSENWQRMVQITRLHKNDERLAWDVFKVPHHCSYKSMSSEKGETKTTPTPEFEWLLEQGTERSVMVSSSREIPSIDTADDQPPHVQTYRRYRDTADSLDTDLVVTMENPNKRQPKRTIIELGNDGPMLKKESVTAAAVTLAAADRRVLDEQGGSPARSPRQFNYC